MIFCQTKYIGFLFYLFCQIGPSKLNLIFYLSLVMCWIVCSNHYFFPHPIISVSGCPSVWLFTQSNIFTVFAGNQICQFPTFHCDVLFGPIGEINAAAPVYKQLFICLFDVFSNSPHCTTRPQNIIMFWIGLFIFSFLNVHLFYIIFAALNMILSCSILLTITFLLNCEVAENAF